MTNLLLSPTQPIAHTRSTGWVRNAGKIRPTVLLWALGVPIPLVLLFFLIRGCSL